MPHARDQHHRHLPVTWTVRRIVPVLTVINLERVVIAISRRHSG